MLFMTDRKRPYVRGFGLEGSTDFDRTRNDLGGTSRT